jgi:hypothetical protein
MRQYYDDGSYLDTDADGNAIGYGVATNGQPVANDQSILADFAHTIAGGLSAAIRTAFAPGGTAAAAAKPAPTPASQYGGLLVLGAGAFALYHLAK